MKINKKIEIIINDLVATTDLVILYNDINKNYVLEKSNLYRQIKNLLYVSRTKYYPRFDGESN